MTPEQNITLSKDGSHTLYSTKYKAHYHSVFGAIEESTHVFISGGLFHLTKKGKNHISIFEMGFGSGLNALLSCLKSQELQLDLSYETIESDPIDSSLLKNINYGSLLNDSSNIFEAIHSAEWNKPVRISESFDFLKKHTTVQDHTTETKYDLIYWDAFAPNCQAFMWEKDIHQKYYELLNPYGVLVSYCSNSKFRKVLEEIGYVTEFLNGPAKKREMIRAYKI